MDNHHPTPPTKQSASVQAQHVAILGTGNFALAFARRCLTSGYSVTLGSRHPQRRQEDLRTFRNTAVAGNDRSTIKITSLEDCVIANDTTVAGDDRSTIKITSLEDCVKANDVIIVALHAQHYEEIFTPEFSVLCAGKILVDVSNRDGRTRACRQRGSGSATETTTANAVLLATLVPGATVVKAFNTVSAYVMDNDVVTDNNAVAVASDDVTARARVCRLARDLGFEPRERGDLGSALGMEEEVLAVFPDWTVAGLATAVMLVFWSLFAIGRFYLADNKLRWDQLPLKVLNKVFGASTLSLLSLTYFPGTCAACAQLAYGSKRRRFPCWLDAWLRARKQLGLCAFSLICAHAVVSVLILSPTYVPKWWTQDAVDVVNVTLSSSLGESDGELAVAANVGKAWMTWIGELSLLVGVIAFLMMSLLAVTSLPSVARALNWSEWRLVHSRLGYVMLTLAVTHVYVMGVPIWRKTGFPLILFRVKFLSIVFPTLVIVSRLLLLLPCVDAHLQRIHLGWERKEDRCRDEQQQV